MISSKRYYEKKLHKLNVRLARLKKRPNGYNNYNELVAKVQLKINSYNKLVG